jgi:hypothetical protein
MLEGITGASNAWRRKVFDVFGPLRPDLVFEDRVIAFRAALLGEIRHVPEPLVYYRRHETNTVQMFHSGGLKAAQRTLECFLCAYRNAAADLETFVQKLHPDFPPAGACRSTIRRRIRKLGCHLQIHTGAPAQMTRGLLRLLLSGGNVLEGARLFQRVWRERPAGAVQSAVAENVRRGADISAHRNGE